MSGSPERDTTPGCAAAQGRRDAASAPSHPVAAASPGNDRKSGRARPRLAEFDYNGRYAYHLVVNTNHRTRALRGSVAAAVVEDLSRAAVRTSFELLAFCVMPDHVHILVLGAHDDANAVSFVQRFKQLTGFRFSKTHPKPFWQQSFYDHAVRREEDLLAIARYIFDNPAEAGLIAAGDKWAFHGGSLFAGDVEISEHWDGAKAASLRPDNDLLEAHSASTKLESLQLDDGILEARS